MKVRYEILSSECYDKNGKTVLWVLFFDGKEFILDKEDLFTIADILKEFFEGMDDTEGVMFPLLNRQKVISEA